MLKRRPVMAVCDIHSVWAVLLVILNKVEVCPLFAALRVFCHTQHIRNMHATWRVAHDKTHATLWGVQNFEMSVNIVTFSLGRRLTDGRTPQRQSLPCIVARSTFFFLRGWQLGSSHGCRPIYVNPISFAFGANATILIHRSLGWAQEEKND